MTTLDQAITLWPELADLRHLDGWTWRRGAADGELGEAGLCGYRQLGASGLWADLLWIFAPDDATGLRFMVDGPVTWMEEGTVAAVLSLLAALPQPGQPGAPLTAINVGLVPISVLSDDGRTTVDGAVSGASDSQRRVTWAEHPLIT